MEKVLIDGIRIIGGDTAKANSWPWMVATRYETIEGEHSLGTTLESLLQMYIESTGSTQGGVPAEILQTATEIPEVHAPIQQAGPSDAVAAADTETKTI